MAIITEKLHPAANIANIKTAIPVVLDYEGTNYNNWATLFKLHCRANLVLDHIVPPADEDENRATQAQWQQEDDIVRQWIYATISKELLNKIISPDDTAAKAWNRLVNMFHDNETASVCHLEAQFNNISLKDFANVKEYCTRIKVLAEKLKNFGKLITDERMVLRLLDGLTDEYKVLKSAIQYRATLPSFDKVQWILFEASNYESTELDSKIQSLLKYLENPSNMNGAGNADQNSALVLSLWHCKLAWFFADSANKNVRRISAVRVTQKAIDSIYKSMIPLSSTIHGRLQKSTNIPNMVEPIKNIVSSFGISHEEWVTELHSLMEELVSINQVLKDYQQRQNSTDKSSRNTLRNSIEHIKKEPKYTVCLLTIWYWLAVWCSPEDHHHYHSPTGAKYEFMSAIQSHHEMLATCLVNPSTTDSKSLPELQKLFSVLIEMLKSDLQYWIDALDQFTDKMANAGILRGQVREVLRAKGALEECSTLLKASEKMSNTFQGRSQLKYLHKKDILKDQVRDAMIDKQTLDLMERIGDIVVNSHHDLKDVKDVVVDVAVITEEYGEEVVEFAEKAEHGKHSIHLDVLQLADTIGEGINHFAEGAGSVCHKFGSFFKTTF